MEEKDLNETRNACQSHLTHFNWKDDVAVPREPGVVADAMPTILRRNYHHVAFRSVKYPATSSDTVLYLTIWSQGNINLKQIHGRMGHLYTNKYMHIYVPFRTDLDVIQSMKKKNMCHLPA
jgi:hypothetical protein